MFNGFHRTVRCMQGRHCFADLKKNYKRYTLIARGCIALAPLSTERIVLTQAPHTKHACVNAKNPEEVGLIWYRCQRWLSSIYIKMQLLQCTTNGSSRELKLCSGLWRSMGRSSNGAICILGYSSRAPPLVLIVGPRIFLRVSCMIVENRREKCGLEHHCLLRTWTVWSGILLSIFLNRIPY